MGETMSLGKRQPPYAHTPARRGRGPKLEKESINGNYQGLRNPRYRRTSQQHGEGLHPANVGVPTGAAKRREKKDRSYLGCVPHSS